jgi:hypothetical protein
VSDTAGVFGAGGLVRQADLLRQHVRLACVAACVFLGILTVVGAAQATTGPSALSKPPRWFVSARDAKPFLGRFTLTRHGPSLISSELLTDYNGRHYLAGNIVVYSYDSSGQEISWVADTYEYHDVQGQMKVDLVDSSQQVLLGHLILRAELGGKLVGRLIVGGRSQPVTYSPVAPHSTPTPTPSAPQSGNFSPPGSISQTHAWGIFSVAVLIARVITAS